MSFLNKLIAYQKKKLIKNFDAAVNHVKHGVYHNLKNELLKKNDEDYSGLMAAAVTNEIFGLTATTQEAKKFAEKFKKQIEAETRNLRHNKEIVKIINVCLRLRAKILYENISSGTNLTISGKAIENIKKYGLLLEQIDLPSTSKFIRNAKSFHKKSMNIVW